MLAIIGSAALVAQNVELGRECGDLDLVGDYDDLISKLKAIGVSGITPFDNGKKIVARNKDTIFECEIAWPASTSEALYHLILSDSNSIKVEGYAYASLNVCYMLKMTHRFKKNSPHFLKTMRDIQLLRKLGAVIEHEEFYQRRLKETLDYKHPKLNQSKKEFFTDDVPYTYDHDSIHEAIKLYDTPAYNLFKPNTTEVLTSRKLFDALDLQFRLAAVYEESCVLALERSQIPYPEMPRLKSFEIALGKVCTSITSGWFREFAWENYDNAMALYNFQTGIDQNYVDVFNRALEKGGVVKPHKK
jgi:hypothetical protein